jgi:hypothetical protein
MDLPEALKIPQLRIQIPSQNRKIRKVSSFQKAQLKDFSDPKL